jgi:hypothetical protein
MRARNIKPDFFRDAELSEVSVECRFLFIGLWCMADREGKLKDDPKQIRFEIFPETKTKDTIDTLLSTLKDHGLIVRYEIDGRRFIKVQNFLKHQSPHHTEKNSVIPDPPVSHGDLRIDNGNPKIQTSNSSFNPGGDPQAGVSASGGKNSPSVSGWKNSKKDGLTVSHGESPLCSREIPLIPDYLIPEYYRSEDKTSEPPVVTIPLVNKTEYPITQADIDAWSESFPGINVLQTVRHIREWNLSNPKKQKTPKGIRKHITEWLAREQDKGVARPGSKAKPASAYPEWL